VRYTVVNVDIMDPRCYTMWVVVDTLNRDDDDNPTNVFASEDEQVARAEADRLNAVQPDGRHG